MQKLQKFKDGCKKVSSELSPASITSTIDVIVVEQVDGTFLSTPFHVRFGRLGVSLNPYFKIINIEVNGIPIANIHTIIKGKKYNIYTH